MTINHFKIAWRSIRKNKINAVINVAGLALSLSCGILIFVLLKHHLSFDNFHKNADRIYRIVTETHRETVGYDRSVPAPLGKVFRDEHTFAEKTARVATIRDCLISIKNEGAPKIFKEAEGLAFAETDFFEIFNFPLLEGDPKTALHAPGSAILTEKMAKKYFGNADPVGQIFWLDNNLSFQVTGILKNLPENTDHRTEIYASYASLKSYNEWLGSDDSWGGIDDAMQCFTLLRPNVRVSEVENIFPPYVKKYRPNSKNVHHYKLQALSDMHFNTQYDGAISIRHLWTLGAIGLLLVLTACVNFINLSTAHALKRAKEIGVRKVLGGMKSQLYWQFIAETALITAIGIVLAVGLSSQMLPLINDFFTTRMTLDLFSDPYLGPFIVGLGVAVTFLAGSYPGFVLARFQPVVALKGSLSQQHIGGFKTRRALIVGQFIVSQILVIGVVVIMSQMQYAKNSDWGFERAAIAMVPIGIDSTRLKMKVLKNEIARIAGVEKVSLCTAAPASAGNWGNSIRFDHAPEEVNFRTIMKASDDQYLTLFGVELVAGRNLFPADSVKEFVVNETLVRKLNLPSPETAIGKTITANGGSMVGPIVGVVKDFHDYSFHRDISPMAFMSYTENYAYIAVKMNLHDAKTTLSAIEQVWKRQFPDQIFESRLLDEQLAEFYEAEDRILTMVQFFSFIALFIGCLGLYGLVSFMVAQKTKEIGVRKVLGGNVAQILWLFGKEFLRLILIAIVIASPIAYYFMQRWLADFAYRIDMQWWMFAGAGMAAVLIAFLTVGFQSVKAALANPVKSLRSE